MPASATVGTSGTIGERLALLTASGRNFSALIWGSAEEMPSNITGTCPPMTSMSAGALPL